ncbi:retrovirus-related pol polyprotein from transposon TNT 1-94 [Tanacetum coccineum]
MNEDKIKKDLEEIETINIELDHRVSKLIAENKHLKQTYKQLYDSIKPARIRSKEQCDDLINQVNLKKLKGKALVDNVVTKHTIDPEMLKINVEPITPKLLNNKTAHSAYINHTQEEAAVLRDLVEHVKANYPLDHPLESACRVRPSTSASGSQPSGNTKKDKIQRPSSRTANVQHSKLNANSKPLCVKCNGCMLSDNHDLCVLDFINNVNARAKSKSVKKSSKRKVWKPTGKVFTNIGYIWRPTSQTFTIVVQIVLWYLDSGCSKHMTGDRSQLTNFVNKFLGTVKFGNDHVAKILGYGDYQIGNVTISRVYYVEGLGHNLFSVGQFCDSNLEVAFRQHTCFIRNLEGVDLLTGSRGNNLYTLSLGDMMASSPICLLSKASKTNVDHPAPEVIAPIAEVVAPEPAVSTGSPSSTTVDQDAPSPSNSQTTPKTQSPVIPNDVEEDNHDLDVAHMNNDPFFGIPIPENDSEASSSSDVIPTVVQTAAPNSEHVTKWTKDHPLDNIIGELERPVSTRLQLHEQALFCYYDAFLSSVEPKTYKDALTQSCWIEAMQEELNEFEHLKVWELVPRLDKVMVITLKWIYKVKLDELGGILKNKARLVAHGYRQEEGINDLSDPLLRWHRLDAI